MIVYQYVIGRGDLIELELDIDYWIESGKILNGPIDYLYLAVL